MSKLKQPVISLEAHGTIGNSLTLKRRRGKDLAVRKPIPAYRRTLPQLYQRWDYQDGIAYWATLTPAEKQIYKSNGAKHHMTGFAYFMGYYLKNLPHMVGRWHLDRRSDAIVPDTSKNNNPGTLVGATYTDAVIAEGARLDGIDDYINLGNKAIFNQPQWTLMCFLYRMAISGFDEFLWGKASGVVEQLLVYTVLANNLNFRWWNTVGGRHTLTTPGTILAGRWYHIACSFDGQFSRIYLDGTLVATGPDESAFTPVATDRELWLGRAYNAYKGNKKIDEAIYLDYALPQPDILRHAERRYP